eukprot:m.63492 g.63492  ORF g.63492 m.63492 type:complete len:212 (+) comp7462_c0_seq1:76-711(+)
MLADSDGALAAAIAASPTPAALPALAAQCSMALPAAQAALERLAAAHRACHRTARCDDGSVFELCWAPSLTASAAPPVASRQAPQAPSLHAHASPSANAAQRRASRPFVPPRRGIAGGSAAGGVRKLPSANAADIAALQAEEARLDAALTAVAGSTAKEAGSSASVEDVMEALHTYNDLKDTAVELIGILARQRGVTSKAIYDEFGLSLED